GSITAAIRERAKGQAAAAFRSEFKGVSRSEYDKRVESFIARGVPRAKMSKIAPQDCCTDGEFALEVEFTASQYAQSLRDRLLIFKPVLVARGESFLPTEAARTQPIVLEAVAHTEMVR